MKIIELHSENIKKIKAIDIRPQDNIVVISGKNEAGKSSVIDSILYGLTGKLPEKPIRAGEDKAVISIDLGDYRIKKVITEKTTRLEVTTKDGHKIMSPQTMLNDIIGQLTFDPLEFANMDKKAQRNLLLKLANIDFSKLDEERKKLYEDRTIITREGNTLKAQYEAFDKAEIEDAPEGEIDIANLSKELSAINILINNHTLTEKNFADRKKDRQDLQADIARLERELNQKKQKLESYNKEIGRLQEDIESSNIEQVNNRRQELEMLIDNADVENKKFQKKQEYLEIEKKYNVKRQEYSDLESAIRSIDIKKIKTIETSIMPIEGLSFNDASVLYNNIPFGQLSSAQKLRVSVAMAMAMNPRLRVIRITDGSLLDSTNMQIIEEMARDKDFQAWIELVNESGEVGFYIEEGEVKNVQQAKIA